MKFNAFIKAMPTAWLPPKFLLVMKLTTLILILALVQVSAKSFSQITLNEKNAPLVKVLKAVKQQSNLVFFYDDSDVKQNVTVKIENATIEQALTAILKNTPLTYTISEKTIFLKKKEPSFIDKLKETLAIPIKVSGKVTDTTGAPLPGATINNTTKNKVITTGNDGTFTFSADENDKIEVSFIGMVTYSFAVTINLSYQTIVLHSAYSKLQEVSIVSTGFQTLPKERATGSFVQIDNALINRSVSTNILDRLNGVTSGLIFTTPVQGSPGAKSIQSALEIRGRSTLFANANPLIVIDNFPYDGDLGNINPNDIESITVLKDAAAASAWGTRSGNGVIVLTTKKGALNSATKVGFSANVTIGEKPNLYYSPQLTSSDYIDVQKFLYDKGAYTTAIADGYSALPAAVEIFRNPADPNYQAKLDALRSYDIRDQLSKYYYQPSVNQQYQANISGGSATQKYFVSGGYDKNLSSSVGNSYNRLTLNASNTYYLLKNKLELFTNIIYTGSKTQSLPQISSIKPYDQIADANGNPTAIANNLRLGYAQTAGNGKLLNWLYKPLDELNKGYGKTTTNLTDYRINLSLSYKIINGLKASALYNYEKGISDGSQLNEFESFYTRNLINQYTQINQTTGVISYPLPVGDILSSQLSTIQTHNGRFQVNYDHNWGKHNFSAVAGTEIRELNSVQNYNTFYGYNRETEINQNSAINYTINNPYFYGSNTGKLTPNTGANGLVNRFFSYYFNGAYTYNDKYIASVSAREDESNLFGVETNQKGVPLWSAGFAWIMNKENFYALDWLPQLKLRATYGYTGNVDNTLSAYLTTQSNSTLVNFYNTLYTRILNPPNPSLRWEKVRNINLGLDFSSRNNRISGSIDLWQKKGIDLIGNSVIAPQTGIVLYTGNSANTLTNGVDIQLNSTNLNGAVKWYTNLLYNYSNSKVTDYKVPNGSNFNVVSSNYNNPLVGFPYYSIFSFKYGGLNATGDPQGYLNGSLSTDYAGISNSTNRNELIYNGSATPTSFGNLRNTFLYKNLDVSFNISYRLGYNFRRNSLQNLALYSTSGTYKIADYENRWQKPGDETVTNVPALIYPGNLDRDNLYTYSNALVEKADNIRLQDIKIGYTFPRTHMPFQNLNLFIFANNVGILWRANKYHIDPDYPSGVPVPRSIAFGLKADL